MKYSQEQLENIEKVKGVFSDYLEQTLGFDLVWSDKIGYVLLRGINEDLTDFVFHPLILPDAAPLCSHFLVELCYDVIERENFCCDATETTPHQQAVIKNVFKPYMDQLPEYAYLIDQVFHPGAN